jgi:biotin synthase
MPTGDVETTLNFMALLRIKNPAALIPTTSSLEKLKADGQYLGLMAGANTVTIHDGTPQELQHLFPIYDQKRFRPNDHHLCEIVERAGLRLMDPSPVESRPE